MGSREWNVTNTLFYKCCGRRLLEGLCAPARAVSLQTETGCDKLRRPAIAWTSLGSY
jgi:hypothetical protein